MRRLDKLMRALLAVLHKAAMHAEQIECGDAEQEQRGASDQKRELPADRKVLNHHWAPWFRHAREPETPLRFD